MLHSHEKEMARDRFGSPSSDSSNPWCCSPALMTGESVLLPPSLLLKLFFCHRHLHKWKVPAYQQAKVMLIAGMPGRLQRQGPAGQQGHLTCSLPDERLKDTAESNRSLFSPSPRPMATLSSQTSSFQSPPIRFSQGHRDHILQRWMAVTSSSPEPLAY